MNRRGLLYYGTAGLAGDLASGAFFGVGVSVGVGHGVGAGTGALTISPPAALHALKPPSRALASLYPAFCSTSAARALVCSDGQVQYEMIFLSFGSL
jgi:hypothetical protein